MKQEVKAEAPTTAAAAAAPAAKVKSRPVSPAAAKDPAPSRRSSRAGKKAKARSHLAPLDPAISCDLSPVRAERNAMDLTRSRVARSTMVR